MRSNQTSFMNKESSTPLYYTARLEIRFLKIKQKKASKAIMRKNMRVILLKKHQITLITWMRKRFVIKKKCKEENPILQIMPFQMKNFAAIDNKII